jgi:NADPH2:quinone reductase
MVGISRIIAIVGSRNRKNLRFIGATHFVDRYAPKALEQIRTVIGDYLVHAIDTVNISPK